MSPFPSHLLRRTGLLLALLAAPAALAQEESAPEKVKVAELTITASAAEDPVPDNPLGPTRRNFRRKLEQMRAIAADGEIAAVRLEVEGVPSYAHALDLLDELAALKAAGKKVLCYSEMLGRNEAMLASTADLLAVPPTGMITLEPLVAEVMYMKDLLAKVDVRAEVLHIGEFKTAYENFSRDSMSDGQRAVIQDLLDEYYRQILGTIAANRGLQETAVEELFEQVFVLPEDALAGGLIDAVAYESEFEARAEALLGGEIELIEHYGDRSKEDLEKMLENPFAAMTLLMQALKPPSTKRPEEPYVGIVYCSGMITSGKSAADFQGNVSSMGSDTIVEALREVGEDEHCKAVVLRVNSPGGSALASDMIWRAIEEVRTSKPVVASMGSVAGSGGYWISMGCDAIIAQPSTITGSIGVVSMVPDVSQALKEWGINVEVVSRGPHGEDMALLANGPTPFVREMIQRFMGDVYERFLGKVSAGRKLPRETVESLAHGRVWTGRQAVENGLVDELGGLRDAVALACVLGGGLPPASTPLVELPQAPNVFEAIEEAMGARLTVRSGYEALLAELGLEDWLAMVRRQLLDVRPVGPDRVLALMPLSILVR